MKSTIFISTNTEDLLHRHGGEEELTLVFCLRGELCIRLEATDYCLQSNDMFRYIRSTPIETIYQSADCEVRIYTTQLHSMDSAFYHCLRSEGDWWGKWNFIMGHPIIHLDDRQRKIGSHFHELITLYMSDENYDYREEALESIKHIFIYEVLMWIKNVAVVPSEESGSARLLSRDALMAQFVHLLEQHSRYQREVQWYADQMHITPKYLSDIVKHITGKTAIQIIRDHTLCEIKNQLMYTDKTIKEIAYDMNFSSLSCFSKYVHQHTGVSPATLRAQKAK